MTFIYRTETRAVGMCNTILNMQNAILENHLNRIATFQG